jgi:hypothetical protein
LEDASEHTSTTYGCNPFDDETSVEEMMMDTLSPEPPTTTPRTVDAFDSVALAIPSASNDSASPSSSTTNPFDDPTEPASSTNPFDDPAQPALSTNPFDDPAPTLGYAAVAKTPSPTNKASTAGSPSSELDATEATIESSDFDSSYEEAVPESPVQNKGPRMNLLALTQVEEEVVREYRLPEELKPLIELSEKPTDRSESIAVFAAIEAKRKGWATSELRGFKEQWGCYKDLIPSMARETEWVEDLLKTSFKSMEDYSSMMRAAAEDSLLDEADRIIPDLKKRSKVAEKRSKDAYNYSSETSVMQPVLSMLLSAVSQLDESVPSLVGEVESMSELSAHVTSKGSDLAKSGDRIMLDMEAIEVKIQAAWGTLRTPILC